MWHLFQQHVHIRSYCKVCCVKIVSSAVSCMSLEKNCLHFTSHLHGCDRCTDKACTDSSFCPVVCCVCTCVRVCNTCTSVYSSVWCIVSVCAYLLYHHDSCSINMVINFSLSQFTLIVTTSQSCVSLGHAGHARCVCVCVCTCVYLQHNACSL